jgi:hypothetical protein
MTNSNPKTPGKERRDQSSTAQPFDDFDPEGWMSERPTYWMDLPEIEPPTRAAWLRHRAREFATWLGVAENKAELKVSQEEWIRLSESALGPLPRPARRKPKNERATSDGAREAAKKPAAKAESMEPSATAR